MAAVSIPRFFGAVAAGASSVTLGDDEAHHLRHVLRLAAGAEVQVFDGQGHAWSGTVAEATKRAVTIAIDREVPAVREPPVRVTLCVGWLKGDQMDAVVRDATMLGVSEIVPMATAHVAVPKTAMRSDGLTDRWQRVAVASARQCGRAVVPAIGALTTFDRAIGESADSGRIICIEPPFATSSALPPAPPPSARLLIGPEGGWSPDEIAAATRAGVSCLSLGPRTLRAETAPVVALTTLWNRWGW